jgi:hypothetical protein
MVFHRKQSLIQIVNLCFLEYFSGHCVIQNIMLSKTLCYPKHYVIQNIMLSKALCCLKYCIMLNIILLQIFLVDFHIDPLKSKLALDYIYMFAFV